MKYLLLYLILFVFLTACDDSDSPSMGAGKIVIEFDNRIGEEDLQLNTEYINASGEKFAVSRLNYFISNIRLIKEDGTEFAVPQDSSYFLIKEDVPESQQITLNNIPAGDYNKISFLIGVDSIRSKMDITLRTGVLDPASEDGMYWTWNSGYIFFLMEGTSPSAPAESDHKFYYHIGGYGGYESPALNNITHATIDMGSAAAQVRRRGHPAYFTPVMLQKCCASVARVRQAVVTPARPRPRTCSPRPMPSESFRDRPDPARPCVGSG